MIVSILGVEVDALTKDQALSLMADRISQHQKTTVVTVNPEFVMAAQADAHFKQLLNQADLAIADGIGLLWAATYLGYQAKINIVGLKQIELGAMAVILGLGCLASSSLRYQVVPAKLTGVDISLDLARLASDKSWSIFLLGGQPGIAERAASNLQTKFANLKIAGCYAGDASPDGDAQTTTQINQHPADIVLVAYGAPKQEFWMERNLQALPVSLAMGVGGTLNYLAGEAKRPPAWVQNLGLEWLFRLITEPWRWRRQLALPLFVWQVMAQKLAQS